MFAFVSAFPKSLHCTDEAQQAETVLSPKKKKIYIYNLPIELIPNVPYDTILFELASYSPFPTTLSGIYMPTITA